MKIHLHFILCVFNHLPCYPCIYFDTGITEYLVLSVSVEISVVSKGVGISVKS